MGSAGGKVDLAFEERAQTFAAALLKAVRKPREAALIARRVAALLEEGFGPREAVDTGARCPGDRAYREPVRYRAHCTE